MNPSPVIRRPHILLVEDEPSIADTLHYMLASDGMDSTWCSDGQSALRSFQSRTPDLVLLDVGLPDLNGFELFKQLQALPGGNATPMLFLTARDSEIDTVVGLELGADDYITKPFSPRELMARIRMVLRRHQQSLAPNHANTAQKALDFSLDVQKRRVQAKGQALDLSRYEYGLLATLLQQPGRVFTRNDLLEQVWDDTSDSLDRTVDAHIKTLRAKLRGIPQLPDCIKTLRGVGYALDDTLGLQIEIN